MIQKIFYTKYVYSQDFLNLQKKCQKQRFIL